MKMAYTGNLKEKLQGMMTEERFDHTERTRDIALEIASCQIIDKEKVEITALYDIRLLIVLFAPLLLGFTGGEPALVVGVVGIVAGVAIGLYLYKKRVQGFKGSRGKEGSKYRSPSPRPPVITRTLN